MAFGRRNNKKSGADAPAEAEGAQSTSVVSKQPQQKKKKQAERLASVVHESAVGAAIDLLKQNDAFALPNGTSWVALVLSAEAIGGLSQKQKGDATKGSIIELIAADKIQVVATKEMLDQEYFGIIPSAETLGRVEEYSLLTEAPYNWAVFSSEDGGQGLRVDAIDEEATFLIAREVSRGEKSLSGVLPEVWVWGGGTVEVAQPVEAAVAAECARVGAAGLASVSSSLAVDDDPMSDAYSYSDAGAGVDYSSLEAEADEVDSVPAFDEARFEAEFTATPAAPDEDALAPTWQSDDIDPDDNPNDAGNEDASSGYYQYVVDNKDRVVDEQEVRDTIARRFLSYDLDLVVDLEEFDRTFAADAATITIAIADDPADWLGSQVAQLTRQANAELARLRQGNNDELREMFIETMALHVEKTMAIVSTDAPDSQYFALLAGAKKDFEAQRALAPQEVSAQRREITAAFEKAADSRAAQAASHARAVYEDKNRPKLERDLAGVGLDLDRRHEEQHAHNCQTVLEMRKKDVNVRMDLGTNRIFEMLRERQADQREDERRLLERWNGELVRFIDENRKDDVARSMALAEQLCRDTTIKSLKAEHTARLAELRTDHAERERRLDAELIRNREDAQAQLEIRQSGWTSSLALEQERTRSNGDLNAELTKQLSVLGEKYEGQYIGEITTLKAEKAAQLDELQRATALQKRANSIMIVLVITLTIAAAAVGIIAGWSWGATQAAETAPAGFAILGALLP